MIKIEWGMMWSDTSDKRTVTEKINDGLAYFRQRYGVEPEAVAIPNDEVVPEGFTFAIWARRENHKGMYVFVRNDYETQKQNAIA